MHFECTPLSRGQVEDQEPIGGLREWRRFGFSGWAIRQALALQDAGLLWPRWPAEASLAARRLLSGNKGTGERRALQEERLLARARMSNIHCLLRWLRLHDDATIRRCDSHVLRYSSVRPTHQATLHPEELPERSDKQADRADVPFVGDLPGAASAVHRRGTSTGVEGQKLPREDVQNAVRRVEGIRGLLPVRLSEIRLPDARFAGKHERGHVQGGDQSSVSSLPRRDNTTENAAHHQVLLEAVHHAAVEQTRHFHEQRQTGRGMGS